jgi:hypothetical protein
MPSIYVDSLSPSGCEPLSLLLLGKLGVVLLESVADALLGDHPLLNAAADASVLAGRKGLGGEVVDAGVEAVLNETAVCLQL